MTRGHRGSLLLRCRAFSSPSPCRFIPAHQIGFNPTARPGGEDYGLLYLAAGDGGAAGDATESLKTTVPGDMGLPQGKILRIDPAGTNGPGGKYGIPATNPFVGRAGVLPEIYASGLRGPY